VVVKDGGRFSALWSNCVGSAPVSGRIELRSACCRFVIACPTTVSSNIILRPVRLHAATKRKRACALRNASRSTGRSAGAPAFGVRRLAAALSLHAQRLFHRTSSSDRSGCMPKQSTSELAHSETLRDRPGARQARQRLECGGLLPLCYCMPNDCFIEHHPPSRSGCMPQQSASELVHSETLREGPGARQARQRLECGGLLPLCYCMPNDCFIEHHPPSRSGCMLQQSASELAHSCACEGAHTAGWKSPPGRAFTGL